MVIYINQDGGNYRRIGCDPCVMTDVRVGVFNSDDENERLFNSSVGDLMRGEIETTINDNEAAAFKRYAAPLENYAEITWSANNIACLASQRISRPH
jgi:hypothetical protein